MIEYCEAFCHFILTATGQVSADNEASRVHIKLWGDGFRSVLALLSLAIALSVWPVLIYRKVRVRKLFPQHRKRSAFQRIFGKGIDQELQCTEFKRYNAITEVLFWGGHLVLFSIVLLIGYI